MTTSRTARTDRSRITRRELIRSGTLAVSAAVVATACGTDDGADVATSQAAADDGATTAPSNAANAMGIDVSSFQGDIDWESVFAGGLQFAFIKATESTDRVDDAFAANWEGSAAAGLARGAYHFFDAEADGLAQAQHFLATVGADLGDLPPAVDIETGVPSPANVQAWLDAVEQATGTKPIVYSTASLAAEHLSAFGSYPLWIADVAASPPTIPAPWETWTVWQYRDSGSIAGIQGEVDLNYFNGPLP